MERNTAVVSFNCVTSIGTCLLLTIVFVVSLYVWKSPYHRDHDYTIIRRFISTTVMLFISPIFLYLGLKNEILSKNNFVEIMGLKTKGIFQAIVFPLILTMVLFLGPISMELCNKVMNIPRGSASWKSNMKSLIWLRNYIVAPLSEEFTFRCCMIPILMQCFTPLASVIICPLFFGIAHFHHVFERLKVQKLSPSLAVKISCFQFLYTTIFGMYSGYIFVRTGHFVSTFVVHAFCNHMGFPDLVEVSTYKGAKKAVIISMFFTGFVFWCFLLKPLTNPYWYHNEDVWHNVNMT